MNKTTIVAFMLLISGHLTASTKIPEIDEIEAQWAKIYYNKVNLKQQDHYPKLLQKTLRLSKQYSNSTEFRTWQAIIIATNAAFEGPFTALQSINKAKSILELVITEAPNTLDGAALVTLGALYYMTPGWPISFGNQDKAERLLKKALKLNPNSIETNYFYADYLLNDNRPGEAKKYFKLALKSPSRKKQKFADNQLKQEARTALINTENRILNLGKNRFLSLLNKTNLSLH